MMVRLIAAAATATQLLYVARAQGTGFFLADAAKSHGAVCLDGTPGAYYLSPGSGSGAHSWYIHQQGGGWCRSLDDCLGRSKGDLGTSLKYPKSQPAKAMAGQSGAMSRDAALNPQMHNWNHVWIKYCDGNSFTGDNATTTTVNGKTLFWRGSRILDAVIASLMDNSLAALSKATEVVVGGGSAGGLATFIHCDRWASAIKAATASAKYACLADSGFFLDYEGPPHPPRFPSYGYHTGMKWAYDQMNSSAGVQRECQASHSKSGDAWKCNFAQHTSFFNDAPLFARQSTYDSWQQGNILMSSQPGPVNAFGANLTALITDSLLKRKQHAVFLDSCSHHCGLWDRIKIDGDIVHVAFWRWWNNTIAGKPTKQLWKQGKAYPCTSCCQPN